MKAQPGRVAFFYPGTNNHFIYKFGNILIVHYAQFHCVKNRDPKFQLAFGRHVKKLRDERGWSQDQLAAMSNIDVNQISRIENGRHAANLHTIKALAMALGKYPDELLRFEFEFKLNTDFQALHKKDKRPQTTASLNKLVETDFFKVPRSVAQIISKCRELNQITLRSPAVSGVLLKLVKENKLKRIPSPADKSKYLYQKKQK